MSTSRSASEAPGEPGATSPAPELDPGAAAARSRDLGAAALVLLAVIWGYHWVVMKIGLRYAQPFTFAALRTLLGTLSLFLVLIVLRRSLRPQAVGFTVVIGLLQTTGFIGLLMWALQSGGAGETSVLTYTMSFWLLLLAWVFLGERLRGMQWPAVGVALAGLLLVLSPWRLQGAFSSILALAAAVSWAASAIVTKELQKRQDVDLLSLTTWQMLFGCVPLILIAVLTGSGAPEWSASFIWALTFNVLLGNVLAFLLWGFALRRLSAGAAGLGTLATPVIGIAAAWLQLGERPTAGEAAGMALIIVALAILTARGLVLGRRERDARRDQTAVTRAPL
jgi:drug/metabolite transporter (DMT)-like permease